MAKPSGFTNGFGPGFGVGRYRYELAPWEWATEGDMSFWRQPFPVVGQIDMRPIAAQAQAGGTPQGFAFVASMQPRGGIAIAHALHFQEESATSLMQDAWQAAMGYRPQGATVLDLLRDQLTDGSDPDGIDGPKPLLPGVDSMLKLFVGGHSLVWSGKFNLLANTKHADRVRTLLQRQYRDIHERHGEQCCRVLDFWCEKYRLNKEDRSQWARLVPPELRRDARLLPHNTTITDNFNRADNAELGSSSEGWSWADQSNDFELFSNTARGTAGGSRTRAESDLSSDDHYAQVVLTETTLNNVGPCVRYSAVANTCYLLITDGRIFKNESGTLSSLADGPSLAEGSVSRLEVDGSSLEAFDDGVSIVTVTDTSITGNLRTGIYADGNQQADDFEAADLAAGGVTVPALDEGMLTGGLMNMSGGLA